jgi:hypothetical protein
MRNALAISTATIALAWFGCASHRNSQTSSTSSSGHTVSTNTPANSGLIVTPEEGLNGTVAWVNTELRFVVVTFPIGQLPAQGQRLNVYRGGLKLGEVKVNGPQQDDSVVADVVAGEAGQGDTVRDR